MTREQWQQHFQDVLLFLSDRCRLCKLALYFFFKVTHVLTSSAQLCKKHGNRHRGGENHALDFVCDIRACVAGRIGERLHIRWLNSRPARTSDNRAGMRVYFHTPVSCLKIQSSAEV